MAYNIQATRIPIGIQIFQWGTSPSTQVTLTLNNAATPVNSNYVYGWYYSATNPPPVSSWGLTGHTPGVSSANIPAQLLGASGLNFCPVFAPQNPLYNTQPTLWTGYDTVTMAANSDGTYTATFRSTGTQAANITVTINGGGGEPS